MISDLNKNATTQTLPHDGACKTLRLNNGGKTAIACEAIGIALLCAGGCIYATHRPATLLFVICSKLLATGGVADDCFIPADALHDFVVYNLPGGLWSASYMFIMHPLVKGERRGRRIATTAAIPMLGIASELMQAMGWLPGTFDALDLLCYSMPIIIYLAITQLTKQNFHL